MSKRTRRFIFVVILVLLTNFVTFGVTSKVKIKTGDKVVLSKSDFDKLDKVYKDYSKVEYIEGLIDKDYYKEPETDKYLDGQLKGLVGSLGDPYSQYLTEEEYNSMAEQTSGVFGGIGVIVTPGEDNLITVVSPIEDTPGEKAGIKPGDKIIKVDGEEFLGEDMDKAVKVMKGEPGTEVELTIIRKDKKGLNHVLEKKIKREIIRTDSVKSEMLDNKIGYIKLTSFDELTYEEFKKELTNIESQDAKGLIIDLRNNPGGLLDQCVKIVDELIGEGDIVYTENKAGDREYIKSKASKTDLPLVVLVNEGSASASEILSGAIKDHKRGTLVGDTTFGKGLVQRIKRLPDGSGLKLTVSEYFTPNGINIHGIGIEPDHKVDLPEDIKGIGVEFLDQDTQLQKAIELLTK